MTKPSSYIHTVNEINNKKLVSLKKVVMLNFPNKNDPLKFNEIIALLFPPK